ncbi:MAG TPA: hypothetical protein VH092_22440 [Urbifossiella sp.]|nr:hypothetical protein [Urbifossiella sp.]
MRRVLTIRNALLLAAVVGVCGLGFWSYRKATEVQLPEDLGRSAVEPATAAEPTAAALHECLGRPASEVVERLRLADSKWYWTDEPPGTLRGVTFSPGDGRQVTLYIAEGEPLFRQFSDQREWDHAAFLRCRVGGIQYEAGDVHLDIGPAVPWQWRQP